MSRSVHWRTTRPRARPRMSAAAAAPQIMRNARSSPWIMSRGRSRRTLRSVSVLVDGNVDVTIRVARIEDVPAVPALWEAARSSAGATRITALVAHDEVEATGLWRAVGYERDD